MIVEAKDLLESVVTTQVPGATVVRSAAEESRAVMARTWPLVALITNPGTFDETEARTVKFFDDVAQTWKRRAVRGNRTVPVLVRVWGEGEAAVDVLFSAIVPAVPRKWVLDQFEGTIEIGAEEHSDHAGNASKLYLSVAEVRFTAPAATAAEELTTVTSIVLDGGEYASRT